MKQQALTYVERAKKLDKKAHLALIKRAGGHWLAAEKFAAAAEDNTVKAMEQLRLFGQCVTDAGAPATGQHLVEWYVNHKLELPKSCHHNALRIAVHIAARMKNPITDYGQCKSMQIEMWQAFSMAEVPHRIEDQQSHFYNPWDEFVSKGASLTSIFRKMEEGEPMTSWTVPKLERFIQTTEPIVKKYEEAKALLK